MTRHPTQHPLEKAARALCRFHGLPEDTMFEGKPMWQSYLDEATTVLRAALSPDDFARLVQVIAPAHPSSAKPDSTP